MSKNKIDPHLRKLRNMVINICEQNKRDSVKKLLEKFGVSRVRELDSSKYDAFEKELIKL